MQVKIVVVFAATQLLYSDNCADECLHGISGGLDLSLTTKKQRSSEMTKQPANLCPYSLRSRNKTLENNQETWDKLTQSGNDVKM